MEHQDTEADPGARGNSGNDPELTRGSLVDRYVVLSRLGAGGMGVVYAAYDPELDRKVALKLLRPELGDERARKRLLREAQALAKLSHPNVVAVHDAGSVGERVWLAMEFVDGQILTGWAAEQPRTWREVLAVMERAGAGLIAAHRAGLIHRDFKPDNVMVELDGKAKVMDLGLARRRETTSELVADVDAVEADTKVQPGMAALAIELTQVGAFLGTPAYMAPELLKRADGGVSADVFAYCVTFWEVLYGERPFEGDTLLLLFANVLAGRIRPAPKDRRVPRWLRQILERVWPSTWHSAGRRWRRCWPRCPVTRAGGPALARNRPRRRGDRRRRLRDDVLVLCLDSCDPLQDNCPPGDVCVFSDSSFICVIDASGNEGQQGDVCEFLNGCDPGLACVGVDTVATCNQNFAGCCTAFCDVTDPDPCPGSLACTMFFAPDQAPPGFENLGVCVD